MPFRSNVLHHLTTRLARGAGAVLVLHVVGGALGFATHVLLARWLSVADYGTYALALGWTFVLARLAALGLPSALFQVLPQTPTPRRVLRTGRWLIGGVGLALAGLLSLLWTYDIAGPALGWAGLFLLPTALSLFETNRLRLADRPQWAYGPPQVLRPVLLGGGLVGGVWVLGASPTLLLVGLCAVAGLWGAWGLQRAAPAPPASSAAPSFAPRGLLAVALPLLIADGATLVLSKSDVLMLGGLRPEADVALYAVALRLAQVTTLVGVAVDAVGAPRLARCLHERRAALPGLVHRLVHLHFWPSLLVAGVLVAAGTSLLALFGPSYAAAHPLLLCLVGGYLANAATGSATVLLVASGHERLSMRISVAIAALNLVLNLVGIHLMGPLGAALATAVSLAARNVWVYRAVSRHVGVRPSIVAATRHALS
ncbi:lipopolysaccharide biosynthesis protein [Salisaeta longa]|uniref:lipopolysaccharide biosynthesis protein n=1 Tax=Salisaeta longa TaxID=503170 RepID=UPI0003B6E1ED|nr:polysaccharide biosynthesis C-terminal domain-containing protein [Salisaeta longa]